MGVTLNWSSDYPLSIDDQITNFPIVADTVHDVLASHVNELASATVALQNVVGGLRTTPVAEPLSPTGGDVLQYNNISGEWEAASATSLGTTLQIAYDGGSTISLAAATPVAITTSGVGQDGITITDGADTVQLRGDAIRVPDGLVSAPTLRFGTEQTGLYKVNTNQVGITTGGTLGLSVKAPLIFSTSDEISVAITPIVNKSTSGNYTALSIDVNEISAPGTANKLIDAKVGGGSLFQVTNAGQVLTPDGSETVPAFAFIGSPTTGLFLSGSGSLRVTLGGTERYNFSNTAFAPRADDTYSLGNSVTRWSEVFVADGSASAPSVAVGAANTGLYLTGGLRVAISGVGYYQFSTGAFAPLTTDVRDLGSGSLRFQDLFISDTVDVGNSGTTDTVVISTFGVTYDGGDNDFAIGSAGAAGAAAAGRDVQILGQTGGVASGLAGGAGSDILIRSGLGGAGDATFAAGAGGSITVTANNAGADGGGGGANGGSITLTAGTGTGAGVDGQVLLGRDGATTGPALAFTSDPDTGIMHADAISPGVDGVALIVNGALTALATDLSGGVQLHVGAGSALIPSFVVDNFATGFYAPSGGTVAAVAPGTSDGIECFRWDADASDDPQVLFPDGISTRPSIGVGSTADGIYQPAADQVALVANGEYVVVDNDSAIPRVRPDVHNTWHLGESSIRWAAVWSVQYWADAGAKNGPSISIRNNSDVGLYLESANVLGLAANAEAVLVDNDSATPSFRPDVDNTWTLGEETFRWADVYATTTTIGDLNMFSLHDNGKWTLNEDERGIYAHNRLTGKSYRIMLEEVADAPEPLPLKES